MTAVLEARGITVIRGAAAILRGVDVEVAAGEVVALIGPNGAGKSTLLGVLAGDVVPTAGTCRLGGDPLAALSLAERARRRAVLPQTPTAVPAFTAAEIVALGVPTRRAAIDAAAYLDRVGIAELAARPYPALSGGERQRVHLARVLAQLDHAHAPAALLLDEPTAALDLRHQDLVLGVVRAVAAAGHAVAIVLHDLAHVLAVADRALLLAAGRVVASGPPTTVIAAPALRDAYGVDVRIVEDAGQRAVITRAL
jgi:iron complex transport system ATP-binding protein